MLPSFQLTTLVRKNLLLVRSMRLRILIALAVSVFAILYMYSLHNLITQNQHSALERGRLCLYQSRFASPEQLLLGAAAAPTALDALTRESPYRLSDNLWGDINSIQQRECAGIDTTASPPQVYVEQNNLLPRALLKLLTFAKRLQFKEQLGEAIDIRVDDLSNDAELILLPSLSFYAVFLGNLEEQVPLDPPDGRHSQICRSVRYEHSARVQEIGGRWIRERVNRMRAVRAG